MEPKSPKSSTAADAAAMRAVVAGAAADQQAKLSKPVADTNGFKTASWTSIQSPAQPPVAGAKQAPVATPQQRPNGLAQPKGHTPPVEDPLSRIHKELAEIKAMLGTLTESIRVLQLPAA